MGLDNYGFSTSFSSSEPPWTTLLLRVLFSGVHDAVMLLEGNAQCEHVVLNSVLVDAFRNCWVPKLWLCPGVSPRSMCQIHQFGDCLVISAIFFEIFPQGKCSGWTVYLLDQKKNPGFSMFQTLVCDLLFLYGEMIAMIHFVSLPALHMRRCQDCRRSKEKWCALFAPDLREKKGVSCSADEPADELRRFTELWIVIAPIIG